MEKIDIQTLKQQTQYVSCAIRSTTNMGLGWLNAWAIGVPVTPRLTGLR